MYPEKKCEFCGKIGPAYTWDVTICPECFKTVSSNTGECWKEIFQLRAKLRELAEAAEGKDQIENLKEPDHFPDPEKRYAFQDAKYRAWNRYQAALKAAKGE